MKIYIVIYENYDDSSSKRIIEMGFKKLEDAESYIKESITELLLDCAEYANGEEDKEFKRDYWEEHRKYEIEGCDLK